MKININGWKLTAIIFICLFIVETITVMWLYNSGAKTIVNEEKCGTICTENEYAGFYQFDVYRNTCYCINGKGELVEEINLE